jgi:DNA-binding protein YbaB
MELNKKVKKINSLLKNAEVSASEAAGLVDISVRTKNFEVVEERLTPELASFLLDFLERVLLLERGEFPSLLEVEG